MKKIKVDLEKGYRIIKDNLYSCRCKKVIIDNARFHHNTTYEKAPIIIKKGILSYEEQLKSQGKSLTIKEKIILEDDYHVNGIDKISLSAIDIDDIYEGEMLYDPFISSKVDFIISSDVKAYRNSINYSNEFLVRDRIKQDFIKSIDIRIIKNYTDNTVIYENNSEIFRLKKLIEYYNCLKNVVISLKQMNLDIPIREMSDEEITLDKNKILKLPYIII